VNVTLKTGRRPPKNTPALQLTRLLTRRTPEHPVRADYLAALNGGWGMLGNDRYGDCVAVTWANMRRLVTATLTPPGVYPDMGQVAALYATQNPGFPAEDNGMDIQTCLEHLNRDGGPDGVRAVAFAKVNHRRVSEVKAAIAIFGSVWTGVYVQQANMNQFNDGVPWDYVRMSPVEGGHSVLTGGYGRGGTGTLGGDEKFITWAAETSFTAKYWRREVEEAWVVVWPEHLGTAAFQAGVNTAKLAVAYQQLTGRQLITG
jgi:hypothetical protein